MDLECLGGVNAKALRCVGSLVMAHVGDRGG